MEHIVGDVFWSRQCYVDGGGLNEECESEAREMSILEYAAELKRLWSDLDHYDLYPFLDHVSARYT